MTTKRKYPMWRVNVSVANDKGIQTITVEIDAPNQLAAETDATEILYYGDGWEILSVESVQEVSVGT